MGWGYDHHKAYRALRAVLHALRDRLHPAEAAGLATQLPLLVRGVSYDGWHPAGKPVRTRTRADLLAPIAEALTIGIDDTPEEAVPDNPDLPATSHSARKPHRSAVRRE